MIKIGSVELEVRRNQLPEGTTILVVDDVIDIQIVLRIFLECRGAAVLTADDGAKAIEVALKEKPDLILMDMQLPDVNGYIVSRRLRSLGFDKPIIAMTAHERHGEQELCFKSGCSDYLLKPVDWVELFDALDRHVPGAKIPVAPLLC